MSEVELRESEALVLPNGVVVSLQDARECAIAKADLDELQQRVWDAKRILTAALVEESKRQGTKTLHMDGVTAVVKSNEGLGWDIPKLEKGLRDRGMPEERIRTIITETVEYEVKAVEANRAARANPEYAALIEECRFTKLGNPSVSVKRERQR